MNEVTKKERKNKTNKRCVRCKCKLRTGNQSNYCAPCHKILRLKKMGLQHQAYLIETDIDIPNL